MNNEHDVRDKGNQISQRSYKIINNNYTSLYTIWINDHCVKRNCCCQHVRVYYNTIQCVYTHGNELKQQ